MNKSIKDWTRNLTQSSAPPRAAVAWPFRASFSIYGDGRFALTGEIDGPSVVAARDGGEAFVLLRPGADLTRAVDIAERLRLAAMALRIRNEAAPTGFITVSVGVTAHVPAKGTRPRGRVEAADGALYAAKRRGRNTTVAEAG
ncbi:MAG: diguanylate cyclase [Rhodoplanes sp.]|uniref:diguanylate cyclase n=1 Tax=Rhodoplanes sp. TaxID=1968906 RepID=UPI0017A31014|nr:diguanylate cyclase [Rhodoplanes sp.]NVO12982.1 diguanylate cyclase [Rhodoplanes sp.]